MVASLGRELGDSYQRQLKAPISRPEAVSFIFMNRVVAIAEWSLSAQAASGFTKPSR